VNRILHLTGCRAMECEDNCTYIRTLSQYFHDLENKNHYSNKKIKIVIEKQGKMSEKLRLKWPMT